MKCPNCNAEVTGRFCSYCGSELPKEQIKTTVNGNVVINNYYSHNSENSKEDLIVCTECGKLIPQNSMDCPNCGYPVFHTDPMQKSTQQKKISDIQEEYKNDEKKAESFISQDKNVEKDKTIKFNRNSVLSIIAFILSLIGCTFIIGMALAIIDLTNKDGRKKKLSTIALIISIIWLFLAAIMMASLNSDTDSVSENMETEETENTSDSINEIKTESEDINDSIVNPSPEKIEEIAFEIFATDLLNSWNSYVGRRVTVSYVCDRCVDNESSIQSVYDSEAKLYIRSYVDNYRQIEYGDYITVTGVVDSKKGSCIEITDAHIDSYGDESQEKYQSGLSSYEEAKRIEAIDERQDFIDSAAEVTYEELRRYPDTYKDKAIKLKLYFESVDPDGWVFQGDIIATVSGSSNEIAVYDGRAVREPRFLEGDTITVYATGNGLATIQLKEGSGIFAKIVDEYEIPSINVVYTDLDNLDSLLPGDSSSEAYEAGKKAAEAVNDFLEQ